MVAHGLERQSFQIVSFYKSHSSWADNQKAGDFKLRRRNEKRSDALGAQIAIEYDNPFFNLLLHDHDTQLNLNKEVE